jgi:F1F0 ATPase subunit 2
MNDLFPLLVTALAGAILGIFYFGGLWWTVQKGLTSENPALWFFGSSFLRTVSVLVGFYFVSSGDWRRMLACLLGFFVARILVTRFTRTTKEGSHASQ